MKGRVGLLCLLAGLASCGLETTPSLSAPPADWSDPLAVTDSKLSFPHDAARYSGTDFQGYVVYYRVYPKSADFARLLDDRTKLSASPTVNQLASMGYQSFSVSAIDGASPSLENLLIQPGAGGTVVTLDFTDFLAVGSTTQPKLLLDGSPTTTPFLYRSLALGQPMSFQTLRTDTALRTDMATLATDQAYELNVFVAAYGLTPTLTEVYSTPVPWGVIRTIQP